MVEARIINTFTISDRGTVVAIDTVTKLPFSGTLQGTVQLVDGTVKTFPAYKEMIARRAPKPPDSEAFLLVGAEKALLPIGGTIEITDTRPDR